MSAAAISPQQRQRILHAHYLRQAGAGPKNIAVNLQVAPATIHEDLHLLEQHRHDIARQAANQLRKHSLADYPDDQLAALEPHRSKSITVDHSRSQSITVDHSRSQSITIDHNRSQSITIDHNRSQSITVEHPEPAPTR